MCEKDCFCNGLITEQEIKVEQIYGVVGIKDLPEEQWFDV